MFKYPTYIEGFLLETSVPFSRGRKTGADMTDIKSGPKDVQLGGSSLHLIIKFWLMGNASGCYS